MAVSLLREFAIFEWQTSFIPTQAMPMLTDFLGIKAKTAYWEISRFLLI